MASVILSLWPRQWCQGPSWLQNEISSLSSQWKNLVKSIAVITSNDLETFLLFFFFPFGPLFLTDYVQRYGQHRNLA